MWKTFCKLVGPSWKLDLTETMAWTAALPDLSLPTQSDRLRKEISTELLKKNERHVTFFDRLAFWRLKQWMTVVLKWRHESRSDFRELSLLGQWDSHLHLRTARFLGKKINDWQCDFWCNLLFFVFSVFLSFSCCLFFRNPDIRATEKCKVPAHA